MDLSPNDIRNYEFATQMRGYSKDEVDDFRELVAATLEALKQDNLKLSMEIDSLKTQLAGLRQFEETIKSAAIDARRNADLTVANAKKEAELVLSRAKTEAMEIVGSRAQKVGEIEDQITKLQLARKSYLSKLRNLIKSHLEVLEEVVDGEAAVEPKSGLEVTESIEVTHKKLETIATKPEKTEPIKTEEANAVEEIAPAPAPTPTPTPTPPEAEPPPTAAEDVSGDQTPQPGQSVDPELAAALEKYQRKEEPPTEQQPTATPTTDHAPAPCEIVETSTRAEDIPEGFVAPETDTPVSDGTDKVAVAVDSQPDATEHNTIDVGDPPDSAKEDSKAAPENLAEELDRVVAKFEEEMDKAEKS
jgi:cell division initiation protein